MLKEKMMTLLVRKLSISSFMEGFLRFYLNAFRQSYFLYLWLLNSNGTSVFLVTCSFMVSLKHSEMKDTSSGFQRDFRLTVLKQTFLHLSCLLQQAH